MPVIQFNQLNSVLTSQNNLQNRKTTQNSQQIGFTKAQLLTNRANRVVSREFKKELKMNKSLEKLQEESDKLVEYNKQLSDIKNGYEQEKKELMEQYGISEDSKEEALLRQAVKISASGALSAEEEEKMFEGFTDYQKAAFSVARRLDSISSEIEKQENERASLGDELTYTKIAHAASNPMGDALEQAKEMKEEANKSLISDAFGEIKENVDETFKENEDKAKEKAEEKKKDEVKRELAKLEKEVQEQKANKGKVKETTEASIRVEMLSSPLPDEVQEVLTDYSKTQNNINNMLRDNKLLIEEAKGLQVDVEV